MRLVTTLAAIKKDLGEWDSTWEKLLVGLGEDPYDPDLDRQVSLKFILENYGLDDALWALRCFPALQNSIKWFAIWCAESVRHLMKDERSINAIDVTRRYLKGTATRKELVGANVEAWEATWAASEETLDAREAAFNATSSAVWEEWGAAADVEAWEATWAASEETLHAREAVVEAASSAVWEKWGAAAEATFRASRAALEASSDWVQEEKAQTTEFVRMIDCYENGVEYTI